MIITNRMLTNNRLIETQAQQSSPYFCCDSILYWTDQGQGLSVGVGMALAAKLDRRDYNTYVLLGDSEMAEGSNYEAMQLANYYKLNNLTAIIDMNRLGQRGETMLGHDAISYKKRFEYIWVS